MQLGVPECHRYHPRLKTTGDMELNINATDHFPATTSLVAGMYNGEMLFSSEYKSLGVIPDEPEFSRWLQPLSCVYWQGQLIESSSQQVSGLESTERRRDTPMASPIWTGGNSLKRWYTSLCGQDKSKFPNDSWLQHRFRWLSKRFDLSSCRY